jgi:hypothetical protein
MQSAHAILYCHLWFVRFYHIFRHYLINDTTFGKKFLSAKWVFRFTLKLYLNTFSFKNNSGWYYHKCKNVFIRTTRFVVSLKETLTLSTNIPKKSRTKFYKNPSSGSRDVPSGQKDGRRWDRHDKANSRFSQLCKHPPPPPPPQKMRTCSIWSEHKKLFLSVGIKVIQVDEKG